MAVLARNVSVPFKMDAKKTEEFSARRTARHTPERLNAQWHTRTEVQRDNGEVYRRRICNPILCADCKAFL